MVTHRLERCVLYGTKVDDTRWDVSCEINCRIFSAPTVPKLLLGQCKLPPPCQMFVDLVGRLFIREGMCFCNFMSLLSLSALIVQRDLAQ